jgi:hypothetical protein
MSTVEHLLAVCIRAVFLGSKYTSKVSNLFRTQNICPNCENNSVMGKDQTAVKVVGKKRTQEKRPRGRILYTR